MPEVDFQIFEGVFSSFADLLSSLTKSSSISINVLILAIVISIISLFIYRFYKSTSKRNIIELNLSKYNYSQHPFLSKFFVTLFYLIEYIIVMPVLLILWYAGLSIVLLLIAEGKTISDVLFISAAVVGAIRILAYFRKEISKDLAKLFPFIALSGLLLSSDLFNISRIVNQILEIPALLTNIFSFIFVIFIVEIVLRIFYTIFEFYRSEEEALQS